MWDDSHFVLFLVIIAQTKQAGHKFGIDLMDVQIFLKNALN